MQALNTCMKTADQKRIYGGILKWWMWIWIALTWKTPIFLSYTKDSSDHIIDFSKINDSDYFLEPLVNDYLNGCGKFIYRSNLSTDPINVPI